MIYNAENVYIIGEQDIIARALNGVDAGVVLSELGM